VQLVVWNNAHGWRGNTTDKRQENKGTEKRRNAVFFLPHFSVQRLYLPHTNSENLRKSV
jgi:hypothetical protein